MKNIQVWQGYHSYEVRQLIRAAWTSPDKLLILCPPTLTSFGFLNFLPQGPVTWHGELAGEIDFVRSSHSNEIFPDEPVLGLFTTGTSAGETKLVLYSKANILSSLNSILSFFDVTKISSIFCYPQPFHTFGLLLGYVLAIEKNWSLITSSGPYSSRTHSLRLGLQSPSLLSLGTPTHFQDLISYIEEKGEIISPSYSCIVGGAHVSVSLWRRLQKDLRIESPSIGYGATEASPGVTHLPPGREPLENGEVGFLLNCLELSLEPGNGYRIRGPSVCLAMVFEDRIEFPTEIFISDDLHPRDDGVLIYHGRNDLVLNRGGDKFSLEQVERFLQQKLELEALAFAVPHPRLGFELGLLIKTPEILSPNIVDALFEIIVRELFVRFSVQFDANYFKTTEEFPMNDNRKPDRRKALELR